MSNPKRPRDLAQLAYTIAGIATGNIQEEPDMRNPAAVALGKLGGAHCQKKDHNGTSVSMAFEERKPLSQ